MNTDVDQDLKIGVVGAGSWGTALANLLGCKGYPLDWWVFEPDVCRQIAKQHENKVYLPGITLSPNLRPTNDLEAVVSDKDLVLVVVPSHVMRETTQRMTQAIGSETIVVSASKGIENKTHLTMSGIIRETLSGLADDRLAVISGPSFAREVVRKAPTVVTVASRSLVTAEKVQHVFATPYFRVYSNQDMIGVELGGAVKNVIAIAAGVIDGLGLGLNTRAALITRGLVEIQRLGKRLGADQRTLAGIAGVGDLILTCTGDLSRNHTVGKKIGEGLKLNDILSEMRMVAEGVKTAKSVYNLSRKVEVEMPICREMYRILYEEASPQEAVYRLMTRDLKHELE
ncbi:MAG: NAD(P)H-dependent glycerol-3-phosphate dehydrogenase [Deltaproteobacteria bacterium]|jgi:glycerol-3-phosphate dehydrogenase (NAD(P)+)|nr:NAD(P)H-dependent glycerol-3-phosphate dehydrogenase [Deltaproteobacteria bacterium]